LGSTLSVVSPTSLRPDVAVGVLVVVRFGVESLFGLFDRTQLFLAERAARETGPPPNRNA
jgi:hypothetical protein